MTVLAHGSGRLLGVLRYHLDVLIASAQCQIRIARSSALLIVGLVQPVAFMLVAQPLLILAVLIFLIAIARELRRRGVL